MPSEKQSLKQVEAALTLALEHAVRMADNGRSKIAIANDVYDAESVLVAQVRRPWVVERMVRILEKLDRNRPSAQQLPLPIPGLVLPPRISTGKGQQRKVPLVDATLPQLVAYRKTLKNASNRKLKQVDELIAFMRKHVGRNNKRATVSEVLKQYSFEFAETP